MDNYVCGFDAKVSRKLKKIQDNNGHICLVVVAFLLKIRRERSFQTLKYIKTLNCKAFRHGTGLTPSCTLPPSPPQKILRELCVYIIYFAFKIYLGCKLIT